MSKEHLPASPTIGLTLGDPAGIGPEVTAKALQQFLASPALYPASYANVHFLLFGPENLLADYPRSLREHPRVHIQVTSPPFLGPFAQPSAASGQAALDALAGAIAAAKEQQLQALVTAPISKTALALAGSAVRGHTEFLAEHLAVGPVAMAFFSESLPVVLATTHIPLSEVPTRISSTRIVEVTRLFHAALSVYSGLKPRLALAGLNPHASENGLFGHEEATILQPSLEILQQEGVEISGPFPPDTIFRRALQGEFTGVVALYHDQGLIPVKLLTFGEATNVTLGLAIPRTSPDHGTAYDLAGQDSARAAGMLKALEVALKLRSLKETNACPP